MYFIDVFEGLAKSFFAANDDSSTGNDLGTTDNKPRSDSGLFSGSALGQVLNFAKVVYNLTK